MRHNVNILSRNEKKSALYAVYLDFYHCRSLDIEEFHAFLFSLTLLSGAVYWPCATDDLTVTRQITKLESNNVMTRTSSQPRLELSQWVSKVATMNIQKISTVGRIITR